MGRKARRQLTGAIEYFFDDFYARRCGLIGSEDLCHGIDSRAEGRVANPIDQFIDLLDGGLAKIAPDTDAVIRNSRRNRRMISDHRKQDHRHAEVNALLDTIEPAMANHDGGPLQDFQLWR